MNAQAKSIGPTPETMRHGDYIRPDGKGSLAVYTNTCGDRLGRLKSFRVISKRQWSGGVAFRRTWERVNGSSSPSRDSTIPPIGGTVHETEQQAERYGRDRARLATIYARVGPGRYALLIDVCCFDHGIGTASGKGKARVLMLRALLCEALDQCAVAYGIHEEGGC